MGSGAVTMSETVKYLNEKMGKKVGVLKVCANPSHPASSLILPNACSSVNPVQCLHTHSWSWCYQVRLFRPWVQEKFLAALPAKVKRIAVLDRCKDVGAQGEPLYLDVCTTLFQVGLPPSLLMLLLFSCLEEMSITPKCQN